MQFQRKPNTFIPFEANQYTDPDILPLGVWLTLTGRPVVTTIQGRNVEVSLGEWIIQEPDGIHYYPCSNDIFRERYERVEDVR